MAEDVTIKDSVFTGRRYYGVAGTYDIGLHMSNNVTLLRCTQTNFYLEDGKTSSTKGNKYWGVSCSNHCKNLVFDTCKLSRYDSHTGLYNGKILNCEITLIELTGAGLMEIKNTTFITAEYNYLIMLRSDYGCTWNGEIYIENCKVINGHKSAKTAYLIAAYWQNLNFGMRTYLPSVTVNGLEFDELNADGKIRIFTLTNTDTIHLDTLESGAVNKNPYTPPAFIKIISNKEGYFYYIKDIPLFKETLVEGCNKT
jgi:hypothetical protein